MHSFHLLLHGRVQGVGFRAFVLRCAQARGICGEVRNTGDGGVEVIAEGPRPALQAFLDEVRCGPGFARVEAEQLRRGEGEPRYRRFTIAG